MQAVAVFCGSNFGRRPEFAAAARETGATIAGRGLRLVYGGARVGLMGELAAGALAAGGAVIGVMPAPLVAREIAHTGLAKLHIVGSMHERKAMMADLADGFLALPGGAGTLEELFEIWTWGQLGYHQKPVGVLNVEGFYDDLLAFFAKQTDEQFMRTEHRDMLIVEADPRRLLDRFADYRPPTVGKWIERSER
jgi:uncharacterized protein (TIGR00730 family)